MNFNKHLNVEGLHAFLGASKYHWIRYDEEKLTDTFKKTLAAKRGTELHDFAAHCIRMRQPLRNEKKTLNMYVNDAIKYNMTPEQILYYSENAFGTADAISFDDNFLRIHDFKSGTIPAHVEQLEIYAALFCLEYSISPFDVKMELRIYQSDQKFKFEPKPEDITLIKTKLINFDHLINTLKNEEGELLCTTIG